MSGRPWLAWTTSGALGPETASLRVVLRSVNDFATRLIVTFGYFSWNAWLRRLICFAWPPRTSWSQTVSVTSPALATSTFAAFALLSFALSALSSALPPGVPQPAASSVTATSAMTRWILMRSSPLPPAAAARAWSPPRSSGPG